MPIDATPRHAFAYNGSTLQMADEHTLVTLAGNSLQFLSTVTSTQHFLQRHKPRHLVAFDVNWRNAEIAITARDPNPEILLYSYPDKKLRGKLQNGATMEYTHLKYSRCGLRMVTLRSEDTATTEKTTQTTTGTLQRLCVWDTEKHEPLKGCAATSVSLHVAFLSFDPSTADHFVLGGDDGLMLYKIHKGKASYTMRSVRIKLTKWTTSRSLAANSKNTSTNRPTTMQTRHVESVITTDTELEKKRQHLVCHAWMRDGRLLVANKAGELVLVETSATTGGSELTGMILEAATRSTRSWIVGVVYTAETIMVAYADGHLTWLNESTFELLQQTVLPSASLVSPSETENDSDLTPALIVTMAPSPTHSKVYVGTREGHIYEVKASVASEEDELDEEDDGMRHMAASALDDAASVAARMLTSCGTFHTGPVLSAAVLCPSGTNAILNQDAVIASGGRDGRLYLWSISKCRLLAETSLTGLFAHSASALVTPPAATSTTEASVPSSTPSSATPSTLDPVVPSSTSHSESHAVITALAARPADPLLLVGDNTGKLRVLCVSKVVGGNGALEYLPLHSQQLLSSGRTLDILELHPTQPMVLAASTMDHRVFILSLDHEKHFPVLAYVNGFNPEMNNECLVDVQWATPPHTPHALAFTCWTTNGALYVTRYHEAGNPNGEPIATQLQPTRVALASSESPVACTALRFLPHAPTNVFLAVATTSPDLRVCRYADLVLDPNERVVLTSKMLAQDGHDSGVTALALYPYALGGDSSSKCEYLLATASQSGSITLWLVSCATSHQTTGELSLEDVQAVKKKTLVPHSGGVTSLRFFHASQEDIYLVSTAIDGCVYLIDVRLPAEQLPPASSVEPPLVSPLYMNVANFAKYEDPFKPEIDLLTRDFLVVHSEIQAEKARTRYDRLKDKTRAQLNDLEMKLKLLLAENDKQIPSERLERDEFVINTAWRDAICQRNQQQADAVRDGITKDLARRSIVRERMKREFWDAATTLGVKLRGLTPSSTVFVYNFPMRRLPKHETLRMRRLELLRLIEYEHQRQELNESNSNGPRRPPSAPGARPNASITALPAAETALTRFLSVVTPSLQWLVDAGQQHPMLNRWVARKDKDSPPTTMNALLLPLAPSSLNEFQSYHLIYHPMAIRTRKQQRAQIFVLKSYVRAFLVEFNREFQELVTYKQTKIDEIEAKNARILEIHRELGHTGVPDGLFRPQWAPDEVAPSILEVTPSEMTQTPYESEEARRKREKEAAERLALERQRQKDDVAGRALVDMMNGTLEVKKETLVQQTLVKEAWMIETPLDEMTSEQKKLLAQFEAAQQKLKEEQEKYKKSLDLELKKLKSEIQELCKAFDDKLRTLQDVYVTMRCSLLVQQLYELRLAEDLMAYEFWQQEKARGETQRTLVQQELRGCEKENEIFAAQVEACRDEWQRALDEDKALEKTFVRELEETLSSHGVVIEHDVLKHVIELYKKRKIDDVRVAGSNPGALGGAGGAKRGKSSSQLAAVGGSKRRLLTDANEAAATLIQNLQQKSSTADILTDEDGENNLDPFQSVELPPRKGHGTSSATTRFVVPLDYQVDRPDGVLIDDRVWRTLNELRTKKILAEYTVKDKAEQFTRARAVAEELRVKLVELQRDEFLQRQTLEATHRQLTALGENAPLLVNLKQGQDETGRTCGDLFTKKRDEDDALLVARSSVESLNDVIQLHGKDQVSILSKIKNFRKNINVMEWEHTRLEMETRDMEERYTDIQLLRVTRELQELFHTGDTTEKQKRELALLDAKYEHVGKTHQSNLIKLDKTQQQLHKQLRERMRENDGFQSQVQQLEMQVQIREDILASRKSAAMRSASSTGAQNSGEDASSSSRWKAITVRRKLVDLAKAQTEEIEYLRMELDKMRRRTFPSFAQHRIAHEGYGAPDSKF
ncbi:hypothetical protein Poli38472_008513 [Pythium oligandrum]|uniref:Cilia- and flagella-associated protein 43 n=1 Tax=Pythium oligandrum TaxID=41045 RepID=A0A8K1C3Q7_PYTOL|nr:hypothetical protein Poli38472_008513 [Pythium oligandrum]|eukprot:TMW55865.1 hypothetical protein Poli38472_008513 [Pythium oligandrum]